ncbi:MAG: S41 family peptidase [Steroidobacteraceae bacterium]
MRYVSEFKPFIVLIALTSLVGCGGGGGGGGNDNARSSSSWQAGVFQPKSSFSNKCVNRPGTDAETGQPYQTGTRTDENNFLRSWTNDLYLWYGEVTDVDPSTYSNTESYFDILKTNAITASGNPKDRFHFTYPTADWQALSQSGVSAGYGAQWVIIGTAPNRRVVTAYQEASSPAATNNVTRGVEVISVDGVSIATANTQSTIDVLNAGLFPSATGQTHQFVLQDLNGSTRNVTLVSASVTSNPVPTVTTMQPITGGKVGYILFNDHIATSEARLKDAVSQLELAGITDLVLDVRYNGGGYLAIASELAYMIAGNTRTAGRTFELLQFNDKHPTTDPVTGETLEPTPFLATANVDAAIRGQALPTLDLTRVFVLTSGDTCSASESIINGLRGVDVEVIQIGARTCGKPYGFYPEDNCGTTYFSIQFRGVNDKGFGEYTDGFVPTTSPSLADASQVVGCLVADDFEHALGDVQEARFAAALQYQSTQTCPPASAVASDGLHKPTLSAIEGHAYKSPLLTNRILDRRR